jgi:hypothetical protein
MHMTEHELTSGSIMSAGSSNTLVILACDERPELCGAPAWAASTRSHCSAATRTVSQLCPHLDALTEVCRIHAEDIGLPGLEQARP